MDDRAQNAIWLELSVGELVNQLKALHAKRPLKVIQAKLCAASKIATKLDGSPTARTEGDGLFGISMTKAYRFCTNDNLQDIWRIPIARRYEFCDILEIPKVNRDNFLGKICIGDYRNDISSQHEYEDFVDLEYAPMRIHALGSDNRILESDGNSFKYVDFRVERCSLFFEGRPHPWDTDNTNSPVFLRNYVNISYPGQRNGQIFKMGVVNLVLLKRPEYKILLTITIRPATRKIMFESVRGFPSNFDSSDLLAAQRVGREGGASSALAPPMHLELTRCHTDTGKLADEIYLYMSVWDKYDINWAKTDGGQLGICFVEPKAFFMACRRRDMRIDRDDFQIVPRPGISIDVSNGIRVDDLFTLAVANLAWSRIHDRTGWSMGSENILREFEDSVK